MINKIPNHLHRYIVEQNYDNYTQIDQACWRFIMKISLAFFKDNADKTYLKGLQKTGITIDKIPKINNINKTLSKLGWGAVCVRGFIPPQAFMEFQSLKIMPIAADMRSHKNLTYTPSPDIVHEAAGHLPIIANKDYSKYLGEYGQIAIKALISKEDMNLYYAIRNLSDIKENPSATRYMIKKHEKHLISAYNKITFVSESALLARMNWWTVEYGLIGDKNKTKIFGAGLLSSVGESENSLKSKVKKIPLGLNCLKYNYDITEQQPQLFITPSYKHLSKCLKKLSKKMSYKKGGIYGLRNAYKSQTLCTIEFESNIEISGIVENYVAHNNKIIFIKLTGPAQISFKNKQLNGHGVDYHSHGYSTPLGNIIKYKRPINKLTPKQLNELSIKKNMNVKLFFEKKITVSGKIIKIIKNKSKIILITFKDCYVKKNKNTLFKPEWGHFDMICGSNITSVYNGPADRKKYYKITNNSINEKKIYYI